MAVPRVPPSKQRARVERGIWTLRRADDPAIACGQDQMLASTPSVAK
jgi:hypothetical protein